ncbi:hypothetical protein WMY93_030436 [Mugilogobius chulae]|uniref:Uncharacterized protein n=1 Tax=Mugilogobius chulae TaxID=88201 RepID=A0AAW0MFF6_9GOBI
MESGEILKEGSSAEAKHATLLAVSWSRLLANAGATVVLLIEPDHPAGGYSLSDPRSSFSGPAEHPPSLPLLSALSALPVSPLSLPWQVTASVHSLSSANTPRTG